MSDKTSKILKLAKLTAVSKTMVIKRIHFLVHGDVQGVFFRKFTVEKAISHCLTGYVRNIGNGKVEGEAQGEEESIKCFLKDLDKGPPAAHVVRADKTEKEIVEGEEEFRKVKSVR